MYQTVFWELLCNPHNYYTHSYYHTYTRTHAHTQLLLYAQFLQNTQTHIHIHACTHADTHIQSLLHTYRHTAATTCTVATTRYYTHTHNHHYTHYYMPNTPTFTHEMLGSQKLSSLHLIHGSITAQGYYQTPPERPQALTHHHRPLPSKSVLKCSWSTALAAL